MRHKGCYARDTGGPPGKCRGAACEIQEMPFGEVQGALLVRYRGIVVVTLKETIFDPQGEAVKNSLVAMGFSSVTKVRMGKYIVVYLEALNEEEAREKLADMARRLLANPVTETYEISLVEVPN